ncbi:Probable type I restriction enzyme BthVORF4518P M protein [Ralstonia mannitolilytica]|nr:Probable type I restriction enzyme BthVORF4518P M protein [Ralstonia mannitolilytica]
MVWAARPWRSRLRWASGNLLYLVTEKFANIDLHPEKVDNASMGLVFEELIRKFAEISNETAGEHFTPREVIRLMVNLLFVEDSEELTPGNAVVRTIYDPTAGTGGMLSVASEYLHEHNPQARLTVYGQELNDESYAICKADMLIKGQDVANIVAGNTLSDDGHAGRKFDYMLANPPFGVEWKKVEKVVRDEHEKKGFDGRFGPGLPRVSDGSMLFLMHLLSKMRPAQEGGSRFGIVLNGSPLFTGGAGSGESEIRRYVLENDLVEAIVGLPTDMFYNTGISELSGWGLPLCLPLVPRTILPLSSRSGRSTVMEVYPKSSFLKMRAIGTRLSLPPFGAVGSVSVWEPSAGSMHSSRKSSTTATLTSKSVSCFTSC